MTIEALNGFVSITADEGKIFRNVITGDILTSKLYLGCNDIAGNYEEILESEVLVDENTANVSDPE